MLLNISPCIQEAILQHGDEVEYNISTPPLFTTLRLNTNCGRTNESIIDELKYTMNKYRVSQHPVLSDVAVISGRGPFDRERCSKEVIVDHWCGCAVLRGADVFAQGVKAAPASMQRGDLVSVYADLEGGCKKGLVKTYEGRKLFVGNGIAMFSRHQLFVQEEKLSGVGIQMTEPLFESPCLSSLLPSLVFPQNLPSAVAVHVLAPRPGERVLDMCAAPGGKTTHIATLMQNTGDVFALDKTEGKVEKIKQNAKNWNLTNIKVFAFDATKALDLNGGYVDRPPFIGESFDRVLLDGPCSALGQRPMLVNRMSSKELQSYPRLQKSLFTTAVGLLKPGCTLVYSTCTLTEAENELMVVWALNKFPCLQLATQNPHLGGFGRKVSTLTDDQCHKLQCFNPYSKPKVEASGKQYSLTDSTQDSTTRDHNIDESASHNDTDRSTGVLRNSEVQISKDEDSSCCIVDVPSSVLNIDSINSDTIGFFIAKFIKR